MRAACLRCVKQDQSVPHDRQGHDRRRVAGVLFGSRRKSEHGGGGWPLHLRTQHGSSIVWLFTSGFSPSVPYFTLSEAASEALPNTSRLWKESHNDQDLQRLMRKRSRRHELCAMHFHDPFCLRSSRGQSLMVILPSR